MPELTGGELVARVLEQAGVEHVFTLGGAFVTDPGQIAPVLERALASDEVWCINVPLDPAAYRRPGQGSLAI